MSDLSRELHELVRIEKAVSVPTDSDRARILTALETRLGTSFQGDLGHTKAASTTVNSTLIGKASAFLLIGLGAFLGAMILFATRDHSVVSPTVNTPPLFETPLPSKPIEPSAVEIAPAAVGQQPAPVTTTNAIASSVGAAPPHRATRSHDSLSEEVALLSRAQSELYRGRADSALRLIGEHEAKFKRGVLVEERMATKVHALCTLGRTTEADVLLARLSPQSLQGEAARKACNQASKAKSSKQ